MAEQYEAAKAENRSIYLDADDLADLADWYAVHHKYAMATEVVEYGLGIHPNNTALLVEQAYLFLDTQHKEQAKDILERIAEESSEVKVLKANLLLGEGKEEEAAKYRDYFDYSESLRRCSSHRLLAIRRAEAEGLLKVSISPNDEECAVAPRTAVRTEQQRLWTASSRSCARCLQTPVKTVHRNGIRDPKQGARRRGSHQSVCGKSSSIATGLTIGAKACDGYRPRISYWL